MNDKKITPKDRLTLSIAEAAEILGCSKGVVYAQVRQHQIGTIRCGKRWLIPRVTFFQHFGLSEKDVAVDNPTRPDEVNCIAGRAGSNSGKAIQPEIKSTTRAETFISQESHSRIEHVIMIDISPKLAELLDRISNQEGVKFTKTEITEIAGQLVQSRSDNVETNTNL